MSVEMCHDSGFRDFDGQLLPCNPSVWNGKPMCKKTAAFRVNPSPPLNILLAEDEPPVAFSISIALKLDGHKVERVGDGEEALARLVAEPGAFDLLITDHSMPRMTGLELVRRLRESAFGGKILVLSAHLSPEHHAAYDALHVGGMMFKPFDLYQLRDTIRRIIHGKGPCISEPEKSFPLTPTDALKLLRLGLAEEDEI